MVPRGQKIGRPAAIDALLSLMDEWPQSWAGDDEDEAIGRHLTDAMRPFLRHLHGEQLSLRTLRRHLNNLWVIGGETIRRVDDEPTLRTAPAIELLLGTIAGDEAPLNHDMTDAEQAALDATARKLLHFLTAYAQIVPSRGKQRA